MSTTIVETQARAGGCVLLDLSRFAGKEKVEGLNAEDAEDAEEIDRSLLFSPDGWNSARIADFAIRGDQREAFGECGGSNDSVCRILGVGLR
jgi:hypothetical protein